jgi:ppGpp synthetase/RelA/SpoT-type nucleotidyltranferase
VNFNLKRLSSEISDSIEEPLIRMGMVYRVFYRNKTDDSISKKQIDKNYSLKEGGTKMQDLIGIRITLYFADDIELVRETLKTKFDFLDETVDKTESTQFKPTRVNLIFNLNTNQTRELKDTIFKKYPYIDNTFEVQLRTVLSEGWHEIDHDLRYKCRSDWEGHTDLERVFNGVFAGLETSDWSNLMVFEKLSYRHYKDAKWEAMFRTKFRVRLIDSVLDDKLKTILDDDKTLGKSLFRVDRHQFLKEIISREIKIPFTISNIVFLCNCFYMRDDKILSITPNILLENTKINKVVS